jgi:hypothetical protein
MATYSISGNVAGTNGSNNGEIVYIQAIPTSQTQPAPQTTVTDSSGNYTFSGLKDNVVYQLKTSADKGRGDGYLTSRKIVSIQGSDVAGVNFSS